MNGLAAGGLGVVGALALAHPAVADSSVTVRGTDLPVGAGLAHVGCASPYGAAGLPLQPYVAQGPGTAPLGARSLGFDTGSADAAGPVAYTGSIAGVTTADLSVIAAQGTTGVAWVGYQPPADAGSSRVWFGHAPLAVPAGGWTTVSAPLAGPLTWAQYDVTSGAVLADGPTATIADLVAERGDGPGLVAVALGCDGAPFNVDAFRFGAPGDVTTYDFEGLATSATMYGQGSEVVAGGTVVLRGSLGATGGVSIPHASMILERRVAGSGWETVRVVDADQLATARLQPAVNGTYRWRFVDRPLAEASTSETYVVGVAAAVTARVAGDDRTVTGTVRPYGAGQAVELRPAAGGAPVVTGTTGADGSYALSLAGVEAGPYVVTTPATADNVAGRSVPVTVTGDVPEPSPSDDPTPTAPAQPTASAQPSAPSPTRTPSLSPDPTPTRSPGVETTEPTAPGSPDPVPASPPAPAAPEPTQPDPTPSTEPATPAA